MRRMLISTVLALTLSALSVPLVNAQDYTVLHTFTGSPDGTNPSPLIRDAEGNLYGTAEAGGGGLNNCLFGCGMVYKIDAAGNQTVLYDFAGGPNGGYPLAALARDAEGNLYGTTQGLGTFNQSVVFKLTPEGQETSYPAPEGSLNAPVVVDAKGNLYGMTPYGGTPNCGWDHNELGCGTLFVMTSDGKASIVHNFTGTDGMYPQSGLVRDSKGNFYGAAVFGGIRSCRAVGNGHNEPGCGTIFKVDVHGNFSVLYTFTGQADGSGPLGVIIDSEGNLYGIATGGGNLQGNPLGYGTIFKLDTKTNNFSVLFTRPPTLPGSGAYYANLLARDSKGNLYGAQ
ncbi:MAG: choice-of-anchor tandem repeat GloVer-containing protein, partial [Terriglobales bacterium]